MNLQVDLLKKSERRYQGIVSMKVMAFGSICVLAGTTILVFLLAGISKMSLTASLEHARREFAQLEPRAAELRTLQAAIDANRKTLAEFENWSAGSGQPMYQVLRSVQKNIPAQMALHHLFAGTEMTSEKDPPSYVLRISGTANGELTAVDAKRDLNSDSDLRSFCGDIKLISSQRDFGETWAFALEGRRLATE